MTLDGCWTNAGLVVEGSRGIKGAEKTQGVTGITIMGVITASTFSRLAQLLKQTSVAALNSQRHWRQSPIELARLARMRNGTCR